MEKDNYEFKIEDPETHDYDVELPQLSWQQRLCVKFWDEQELRNVSRSYLTESDVLPGQPELKIQKMPSRADVIYYFEEFNKIHETKRYDPEAFSVKLKNCRKVKKSF